MNIKELKMQSEEEMFQAMMSNVVPDEYEDEEHKSIMRLENFDDDHPLFYITGDIVKAKDFVSKVEKYRGEEFSKKIEIIQAVGCSGIVRPRLKYYDRILVDRDNISAKIPFMSDEDINLLQVDPSFNLWKSFGKHNITDNIARAAERISVPDKTWFQKLKGWFGFD